ncbi:MAG: hypothetical protein ABUL64_04315 [Singulisphaera sp.]
MSQLAMTQPTKAPAKIRLWLAVAAIAGASLTGCAHMYENVEMSKTSLPPHYPHPFEAPVNYGYFPTLWRPWPGAEAVPGQTMSRAKEEEEETTPETTGETLPEPSNEPGTEGATEPGMENIFDLPENAREMPEEGAQPEAPDNALPDNLIPPQNEAPATEEPQQPNAGPEAEQIPDELIPNENAAAPPESASVVEPHELEELPFDAPAGELIPKAPQAVAAKPRPGLLIPTEKPTRSPEREKPAIESAVRPGTRQGAKAMLSEPENALRELSGGKSIRTVSHDEAFADGPQLVVPAKEATTAPAVKSADGTVPDEVGTWKSTRQGLLPPRVSSSATKKSARSASAEAEDSANWRPSRGPRLAMPATQAVTARPQPTAQYPTVRTSHEESVPPRETRLAEKASGGSANPLR